MNTIKAGVKALHLDTGETEMFSTVREAAEYMARYGISASKIYHVLSKGKSGLDQVRGWTFAYVNEPFKVTDSSGRVRNRERHVWYLEKKWFDSEGWRPRDPYRYAFPDGLPLSEAVRRINGYQNVDRKFSIDDIVRMANTEKWYPLGENLYIHYHWID